MIFSVLLHLTPPIVLPPGPQSLSAMYLAAYLTPIGLDFLFSGRAPPAPISKTTCGPLKVSVRINLKIRWVKNKFSI